MASQANLFKFFSRDFSRSSLPITRHQDDVVVEDEKHNKNSNHGEEKDEKQSTPGEGKIATTQDPSDSLKPSTAFLTKPIFPCLERRRTQGRTVSRMRILRDLPDDGDECVPPHQTHESSEEEEDNSCSKSSSSTSSSSAASLPKDFQEDVYSFSSSSSSESDDDSSSSPEKDGFESECDGGRTRNAKGKRKQMQEHSKVTKSTKRIRKRV